MGMNFPEFPHPHCPLCKLYTLLGEQAISAKIVIKLQNSNLMVWSSTQVLIYTISTKFFFKNKTFLVRYVPGAVRIISSAIQTLRLSPPGVLSVMHRNPLGRVDGNINTSHKTKTFLLPQTFSKSHFKFLQSIWVIVILHIEIFRHAGLIKVWYI